MATTKGKKHRVLFLTNVSYGFPADHDDYPALPEKTVIAGIPVESKVPQSAQWAANTVHDLDERTIVELLNHSSGDALIKVLDAKEAERLQKVADDDDTHDDLNDRTHVEDYNDMSEAELRTLAGSRTAGIDGDVSKMTKNELMSALLAADALQDSDPHGANA